MQQLDRRVVFSDKDLVTYSPATKDHVGPGGMPLADICNAAVTLSDSLQFARARLQRAEQES